jgi:penicillin-binding protein 3
LGFRKCIIAVFLLVAVLAGAMGCSRATPEQALQTYVANWQNQNFTEMYKQLTTESKRKITQDQFVKRHKDIYEGIGLKKLEIKPEIPEKIKADKDGMVSVPVKVSIDTLAGPVLLPLQAVLTQEKQDGKKGWFVAWDTKSIFPQLEENDKVRAQRLPAKRGEIKDRQGRGLAVNGNVTAIGVVPEKLTEKDAAKAALAQALGITAEQVDNKLNQAWVKPNFFVPISKVSVDTKANYTNLAEIKGIFLRDESARVYPYKEAAAHLTGYLGLIGPDELAKLKPQGYTDTSLIGKSGLEQVFETRLRGEAGGTIYIEDPSGNKKETIAKKDVKNGEDIQLAIDIELQKKLYQQLLGEKGSAVASNPKTGEILALVSSPSYDPNLFTLGITENQWKSLNDETQKPMLARFTQTYSPGSTFKVITTAIGLKTGKLNPSEAVNISGLQWQKDSTWGNYYVTRMGDTGEPVNLTQAFVHSDNIFFAKAALKIGSDTFQQEAKGFGLGEQVPFAMSLQTSQLAGKEGIKGETQLADTGYGQGQILMNPLHLAVIYAGLVNSGNLLKPTLELKQPAQPEIWKDKAFTQEGADRIFKDLLQVVEQGTASNPKVQTPMAGKTGTAELKKNLADQDPKENGWFVAINRDNPRLLVLMLIEDVKTKGGSHYVVPKVKTVLDDTIRQ